MQKYYSQNTLQRVYAWTGFIFIWSAVAFILWSMIWNDTAITLLVKIFS